MNSILQNYKIEAKNFLCDKLSGIISGEQMYSFESRVKKKKVSKRRGKGESN